MAKIRKGLTQTKSGIKSATEKGDSSFGAAMGDFAAKAEETKGRLEGRIKEMDAAFKVVCQFLGEKPPPKTKSDELFGSLSRFIAVWKSSVNSYREKSLRKAKSEKRDAEKAGKSAMKMKLSEGEGEGGKAKGSVPRGPPMALKIGRGAPRPMARGAPRGARPTPRPARAPPGVKSSKPLPPNPSMMKAIKNKSMMAARGGPPMGTPAGRGARGARGSRGPPGVAKPRPPSAAGRGPSRGPPGRGAAPPARGRGPPGVSGGRGGLLGAIRAAPPPRGATSSARPPRGAGRGPPKAASKPSARPPARGSAPPRAIKAARPPLPQAARGSGAPKPRGGK